VHVFSFAPVVGVEYFRVFFGRERCVLCFCAKKKTPVDTRPLMYDTVTRI